MLIKNKGLTALFTGLAVWLAVPTSVWASGAGAGETGGLVKLALNYFLGGLQNKQYAWAIIFTVPLAVWMMSRKWVRALAGILGGLSVALFFWNHWDAIAETGLSMAWSKLWSLSWKGMIMVAILLFTGFGRGILSWGWTSLKGLVFRKEESEDKEKKAAKAAAVALVFEAAGALMLTGILASFSLPHNSKEGLSAKVLLLIGAAAFAAWRLWEDMERIRAGEAWTKVFELEAKPAASSDHAPDPAHGAGHGGHAPAPAPRPTPPAPAPQGCGGDGGPQCVALPINAGVRYCDVCGKLLQTGNGGSGGGQGGPTTPPGGDDDPYAVF